MDVPLLALAWQTLRVQCSIISVKPFEVGLVTLLKDHWP